MVRTDKGLIKVKAIQKQRAKILEKRKALNQQFDRVGIKGMLRRPPREKVTPEQAEAITDFWENIWGVKGDYDLEHPAMKAWQDEMREQTQPGEGADSVGSEAQAAR